MMKTNTILLFIFISLSFFIELASQAVPRKILVEHFTNTRCSVCASRNPGFYNALAMEDSVIHIAYHPSIPFADCLFSTQNRPENDARTIFYDLFFGTPNFVINGVDKSSTAVQDTLVYNPFENQTSPLQIQMTLTPSLLDSLVVNVSITTKALHSYDSLSLYIPMVEDTVIYTGPNGEPRHYDVFRKSFTGKDPIRFKVPKMIDSTYNYNSKIINSTIWNEERLDAIAIIQVDTIDNKSIVQVEKVAYRNEIVLPVEFHSFTTTVDNKTINLRWRVGSKVNASHFKILRGSDGYNFNEIGEVKITESNDYNYDDTNPLSGINYYRLQEVDFDGHTQYSDVVAQNFESYFIRIYPSVISNGILHIDYAEEEPVNIIFTNLLGEKIYKTALNGRQRQVDVSSLLNGVYFISIESKSRTLLNTERIVIVK